MASRRSRRSSSRRSGSRRSRRTSRHARPSLRAGLLKKLRASGKSAAGMTNTKSMPGVKITIGRKAGKGSEFVACSAIGAGTKKAAVECAEGRNPRVAIASSLRKIASKYESRSGAFAALNGMRRRRRRSRR